jgi:hypothetical protein
MTNDINFEVTFDSPNPGYKSFMIIHGWSEKSNTYKFDTNVRVNFYHIPPVPDHPLGEVGAHFRASLI